MFDFLLPSKSIRLRDLWLDEVGRQAAMRETGDLETLRELNVLLRRDVTGKLWQRAIANGWTVDELDRAYCVRFNVDYDRLDALRRS